MNRPDFATASRNDICAYAMTLEMLNSNQAVLIQRQGEAIRQQDERLSALEELASNLKGTIEDLKYNLEQSKMMYQNLARIHYGTKSERIKPPVKPEVAGEQLAFVELADASSQTAEPVSKENDAQQQKNAEETVQVSGYTRKKKRTMEEILEGLPVRSIPLPFPVEEQVCPRCGNTHLVSVGENTLYTDIIVTRPQVIRLAYIGERFKCPECEGSSDHPEICEQCRDAGTDACRECPNRPRTVFVDPKLPEECKHPLLKGTKCSESIMAQLYGGKIEQGLPLYRMEKEWERMGFPLPRQTMSNWMLKIDELYFDILVRHMLDSVKKDVHVLHNDETHIKVIRIKTREGKVKKCHMWVVRSGKFEERQIVVYVFRKSRKAEEANDILDGYTFYFVTDGYSGYNGMARLAIRCGCWDHTRRYFYDAVPNHDMSLDTAARKGTRFCDALAMIERELENVTPEERLKVRLEKSLPIVEEFFAWVRDLNPGNDQLKKAKKYALNQEECLRRFLEDGRIPISNNPAENAIRPFVIGRKNFLFCVSEAGAQATANAYSLAETAKANGLDVPKYFEHVLHQIRMQDGQFTKEFLDTLLPWNDVVQKACKQVQI